MTKSIGFGSLAAGLLLGVLVADAQSDRLAISPRAVEYIAGMAFSAGTVAGIAFQTEAMRILEGRPSNERDFCGKVKRAVRKVVDDSRGRTRGEANTAYRFAEDGIDEALGDVLENAGYSCN